MRKTEFVPSVSNAKCGAPKYATGGNVGLEASHEEFSVGPSNSSEKSNVWLLTGELSTETNNKPVEKVGFDFMVR